MALEKSAIGARLEKGYIIRSESGERMFLMPAQFYKAIYESLERVAGPAAKSLMYYIGVNAGRSMARDVARVRSGESSFESLEAIGKLLEGMGIGRVVRVEKKDDKHLIIELDNTLSEALGINGGYGCHLERGLVAGMLSEVLGGKRVVAKQAANDKCLFEVVIGE